MDLFEGVIANTHSHKCTPAQQGQRHNQMTFKSPRIQ